MLIKSIKSGDNSNQLVKVFMFQITGDNFNTSAAKMSGKILTPINIVISVTFHSI